ncbi:MAG TPA: hypothetical protein VLB51_10570 [Methylomirabilota bacterium]|nr:hypothetical protein [Methylomirabilota bacterium]
MRGARATLIAVLLVGAAAAASAGSMTLTRHGELYRVAPTEDGLVLVQRLADGTVVESLIPQTAGIAAASVQVGVDEFTGAAFVIWETGEALDARVEIAWLVDQTWSGPFVIAGADGTAARNPQLLLDRVVTLVEEDGEPAEVSATFLHIVWWSFLDHPEDGSAYLASIPLNDQGTPDFDLFAPIALEDFLPYGVGCQSIEDAAGLAYPKVFTDPQSGAPHVFATDFANCVFQIFSLNYEVVEEWVGETKRRRHIVLLGNESMIALNPDLVLASAKVEVGHGLDVLMYWEVEGAIAYVQLDENGIPPVQTLTTGDDLTMEQAEEMVRSLVR